MKQQAIKKINTIGKIGHIISIISKIAFIAGFVGIIIATITLFLLPDDIVSVKLGGTAHVDINVDNIDLGFKTFKIDFTDKEKADIEKLLEEKDYDVDINDMNFSITNANVDDSSISFDATSDNLSFKLKDLIGILIVAAITIIASFILVIFIDKLCIAIRNCNSPFEENVIKKLQNLAFSILGWSIVATITKSVISSIITRKIQIMVGIDLGMLTLVLIILAIAYIFKYGAALQQESDETL